MIVLSLILVIAAAVLLVLGVFQDGLLLIYLSIASCLLAMALLGIGVLLRRRDPTAASATAGPSPAATPVAPAVQGRRVETPRAPREDGPVRDVTEPVPPVEPDATREAAASAGAAAAGGPVAKRAVVKKAVVRKPADPAVTRSAVVKKAAVRRVAADPVAAPTDAPTGGGLDAVKGLGPARRQALLERFGDEQGIREASVDDLTQVRGVGPALAQAVKDALD